MEEKKGPSFCRLSNVRVGRYLKSLLSGQYLHDAWLLIGEGLANCGPQARSCPQPVGFFPPTACFYK